MKVIIIDYGLSNLLSVKRAVEYCGFEAEISSDRDAIKSAECLILPGVGAFSKGMEQLRSLGLDGLIREHVAAGKRFLGICLGMQMMFSSSEEGGIHAGLGIIPGTVEKIPDIAADGTHLRVPHVSWQKVSFERCPDHYLFNGIESGSEFYFVHSYEGKPLDNGMLLASCVYGGRDVTAIVSNKEGNAIGCQFHPEKSGHAGLALLNNFLTSAIHEN